MTFKEFRDAVYLLSLRRLRYILFSLFFYLALFVFVSICVSPNGISWIAYAVPIVLLILLVVSPYQTAASIWARDPSLKESRRYTLTEEYLRIDSPSLIVEHKWKNFLKTSTTRGYFLLFVGQYQTLIFPLRVFRTAEEEKGFKQFILSHMSTEKKLAVRRSIGRGILERLGIWLLIIIVVFLITWFRHK